MASKRRTAVGEHISTAEKGLERAVNGLSYARAALESSTLPWARGAGSFVDFRAQNATCARSC